MSDITVLANRLIPIDVELYDLSVIEFPDINVVGVKDAEYRIQFTLKNKASTSPYAVGVTDLSTTDQQEFVITSPEDLTFIRKAIFLTNGSDGIIFYVCQLSDLNTLGLWKVRARITEGDVVVNYPDIIFSVE